MQKPLACVKSSLIVCYISSRRGQAKLKPRFSYGANLLITKLKDSNLTGVFCLFRCSRTIRRSSTRHLVLLSKEQGGSTVACICPHLKSRVAALTCLVHPAAHCLADAADDAGFYPDQELRRLLLPSLLEPILKNLNKGIQELTCTCSYARPSALLSLYHSSVGTY